MCLHVYTDKVPNKHNTAVSSALTAPCKCRAPKGGRDRVSFLASLFVGRPQVIAVVAGLFLLAYYVMRLRGTDTSGHPRFLLMVALAWGFYAAWEAAVLFFTPEANIRVDLLLIWPLLGLFSIWAVYRAL